MMQRWRDISSDPNSPIVLESRRAAIAGARARELVFDRVAYLSKLVAGRSVLDIGVVEHTSAAAENPRWLHAHLKRHAAFCIGIDVVEAGVKHLNELGYHII